MSLLILKCNSARSNTDLTTTFETRGGNHSISQRIINFITSLCSGTEGSAGAGSPPSVAISIQANAVAASGTLTFSNHATANDTFLLNGVTFTGVAGAAGANQFTVGASAATSATAIANAINTSVSARVAGYVTAVAVGGIVTITSTDHGIQGNQATIVIGTDAGTVMTVSGARLAGGAVDPTAQTLSF